MQLTANDKLLLYFLSWSFCGIKMANIGLCNIYKDIGYWLVAASFQCTSHHSIVSTLSFCSLLQPMVGLMYFSAVSCHNEIGEIYVHRKQYIILLRAAGRRFSSSWPTVDSSLKKRRRFLIIHLEIDFVVKVGHWRRTSNIYWKAIESESLLFYCYCYCYSIESSTTNRKRH